MSLEMSSPVKLSMDLRVSYLTFKSSSLIESCFIAFLTLGSFMSTKNSILTISN